MVMVVMAMMMKVNDDIDDYGDDDDDYGDVKPVHVVYDDAMGDDHHEQR